MDNPINLAHPSVWCDTPWWVWKNGLFCQVIFLLVCNCHLFIFWLGCGVFIDNRDTTTLIFNFVSWFTLLWTEGSRIDNTFSKPWPQIGWDALGLNKKERVTLGHKVRYSLP